jgi:beta-lactamase class A
MKALMSRRQALAGSLLAVSAVTVPGTDAMAQDAAGELAALERRHAGSRIGVSVLDLASGKRINHRADERMLMCSTFKAIAAALVLYRVDRSEEKLDRRIKFTKGDLVPYSPATQPHAGEAGMTIAELCEATVTLSDNTAGNLILNSFGGPAGLTAFFRTLGDNVSRLDRIEPGLNAHDRPGDVRDTTSAAAMLETLRRLLFTDVLSPRSRSQLAGWLITNKTGDSRLRAGVPKAWLVGDKTGTSGDAQGNAHDIAVVWPRDRAPIIVTAYCEIPAVQGDQRNAVIAEIGRIAARI